MAIAVITEDFVTRSGLITQGTGTVTSSTGQTSALQVNSGAAIAKNLIVGTTATIGGNLITDRDVTISGDLLVLGVIKLKATTATSLALFDLTTATIGGEGTLKVAGGAYIGNNIVINGTNASTGTIVNNSLYVAGGVGIAKSLVVAGQALFQGDVVFTGATTNVYSTNTVYTDNLLELHVPNNTSTWTIDDGKDIGLRFNYYSNSSNQRGALVLANSTKYLEWYNTGAESTTGTFTATTYGTFKTGNIILTGTDTAITTQSGALQVIGGVAIGKDLFVAGIASASTFTGYLKGLASTASNIIAGSTGSLVYQSAPGISTTLPIGGAGQVLSSDGTVPVWYPLSTVPVDYSNTSSNINAGANMQIPYQTGYGTTAFEYDFRYDYTNNTLRTVNAVFTGTTNSTSTITGALQVAGGVGIGGNLYVGGTTSTFADKLLIVNSKNLGTPFDNASILVSSTNRNGFIQLDGNVTSSTSVVFSRAGTETGRIYYDNTNNFMAFSVNGEYGIGGPTERMRIAATGISITTTTNSTSTTTGALTIVGGVGIGQALYVGEGINVGGNIIPTNNNISLGSLSSPFADIFLGANSLYIDTIKFSGTLTNLILESLAGPVTLKAGAGIFTNTTNASSTITGAIQVVGGVGIGKNLYVGGNEVIFGDIEVRGGDFTTDNTTFNLINSIATTVNFAGSSTALTIGTSTGYVSIRSLESASSTTGALRVAGGVGIGGNLYVGGDFITDQTTYSLINTNAATVNFAGSSTALTIGATSGYTNIRNVTTLTNATSATSTSTGALTVRGGVGIGGDLYIGGTGYINNNEIIHAGNAGNFGVSSIRAGTDTAVNTSSGIVTISNTSTLQTITNRGSTTTNVINITNTGSAVSTITGALRVVGGIGVGSGVFVGGISTFTNIVHFTSTASSANTTTGALRVIGGVGVGGNIFVSGIVTATLFVGRLTGVATTATNIANGGPGQLIYQSSTGTTGFVATGTVGQILISGGTDAAIFVNTSTFTIGYANNIVGGNTGTLVYQTAPNTTDFITTGSLYVGSAVTATNIVGGNIGSLPYQSNVGITTMLPLGNSGFLLTSNGTVPEWVGLGSLSAGTATNVSITSEVSTSNVHYITFVSTTTGAAGIRTSGPSGLTYIPSTGAVKISGATNITSNTAASSTITGALIVAGGVGIGGNLYIGGNTIETDEGTVSLLNGIATTVNFAGAGTIISIGASTGTTTVNNNLTVRGDLVVQGTRTVVDTTVTNFIDPIITLGGVANNGPYIIDTNQDKGIAFNWFDTDAKTGFFGYKDSLGFFTFIPNASFSGDVVSGTKGAVDAYLAGGASNSIVYQSAPNITAFLSPATTSGWVLASTGVSSAPTWIKVATEGATTSTNIGGGTRGQIPFQTNTGTTAFFGPGTAGNLLVSAGTTSTGPVFQNTLTLAGTTTSISTTTGALQVKGGVGIGGSVYVSNRVGFVNTSNISTVYQYYNVATNSLDTVFG
jgi:hypothetical protein